MAVLDSVNYSPIVRLKQIQTNPKLTLVVNGICAVIRSGVGLLLAE